MKFLISILGLFPLVVFSQHDSLYWFINKQVNDYKIPALAIGVIKNNRIVYKNGFGNGATPETVFPILSCTKAFTAAAIGILVDEGKLKWDDKVIKYLPRFKLKDAKVTRQLTIRDILGHRSGLESFEGDLLWYGTDYSREEIIKRIRYSPLKNKFRNEYGYQNIMYLVAGEIVKKVTGKKWEDFLKEKIFIPLQMNNTTTTDYLYNIAPSGAIQSNIIDMLTWIKVWMDSGSYNGKKIISNKSIADITTPQIFISDKKEESYGMGWQIEADTNNKVISHGGGMPGYKSLVIIDIKNKNGLVLFTNKITYLNEELAGIVLDYFNSGKMNWMEKDKGLQSKNFRFGWDDAEIPHQVSVIPGFDEYTGTYEDIQYGKTVIKKDHDTAVMEFLPAIKQYKGYLSYINKDTLHIVFNDPFISGGNIIFRRNKNKIRSFKFEIPPGDFIFSNFNFIRKDQ